MHKAIVCTFTALCACTAPEPRSSVRDTSSADPELTRTRYECARDVQVAGRWPTPQVGTGTAFGGQMALLRQNARGSALFDECMAAHGYRRQ